MDRSPDQSPNPGKPDQGSSKRIRRLKTGGLQERRRKAGMDITWLTERIAVGGGIWTAENMKAVAKEGITHIIDMQIEFDDTALARARHRGAVESDRRRFRVEAARFVPTRRRVCADNALELPDAKVFVHCAAGVHRAPMMALALLGSMGWGLKTQWS